MLLQHFATDPRSTFRTITLRGRRKDCLTCGDDDTLATKGLHKITRDVISQGHLDYQAFCGILEDVNVLGDEKRISAAEFLEEYGQARHGGKRKRRHVVVDVREEHEFELGPKIAGSVNVPLSKILRHGGGAFDSLGLEAGEAMGVEGGISNQASHIGKNFPKLQGNKLALENASTAQEKSIINHKSPIPIELSGDSKHPTETTSSSEVPPDGVRVNQESHIPITADSSFTSGPERTIAKHSPTIEPDEGMENQESHIAATQTQHQAVPGPDGGGLDQEPHVSVKGQNTFSSSDFPSRPTAETTEDTGDEDTAPGVYFVCQRGNDSQIAAQKLMKSLEIEEVRLKK